MKLKAPVAGARAHGVTVHRFAGVRHALGPGQHVADQGSVEITGEVAGVVKAETGSNGSVTGTARAVRRVMVDMVCILSF